MIALSIQKESTDPTLYRLQPGKLLLGAQNANLLDELHFSLPAEWAGCTVRATFIATGGQRIAFLLPENGILTVTDAITRWPCGTLLLDACNENGFHAYTGEVEWRVATHATAGGSSPAPHPDEWQQLVQQVQQYSTAATAAAADIACRIEQFNSTSTLIAGNNIEIGADGRTISVVGGDGVLGQMQAEIDCAAETLTQKANETDLSHLSETTTGLCADLAALGEATATFEPVDITRSVKTEERSGYISTSSGKVVIVAVNDGKTVLSCNVSGGERYRIKCSYFKNKNSVGYAIVRDDETLLLDFYDPDVASWKLNKVFDIVIPQNGAKLYVLSYNENNKGDIQRITEGKIYKSKSYSKNETYSKVEVDSIVRSSSRSGYITDNGKVYADLASGKNTGSIENALSTMEKDGIPSKKITYFSTSPTNYYVYTDIETPTENIGFWAHFDKNAIADMQAAKLYLAVYLQDSTRSTTNTLRYTITSSNLMAGWFFYKIPLSYFSVVGAGNAHAISRVAIYVSGTYTNHPKDITFYINRVVTDSKTKTLIMFHHDGVYASDFAAGGKIDTYKANGIPFTVFGGEKADDSVGTNTVSELYFDLISDGICEAGQHACKYNADINAKYGFTDTKTLLQSDTYPSWEQYEELKKTRDYIADHTPSGIPVAWSAPSGIITMRNYNQLHSLGFRIARTSGYTLIGNFDPDCFCVASQSIYKSDTVQSIKNIIDQAIASGCSLSLFCHQVYSGGGEHDADTNQFREIVEYVKAKQDLGLCEAVTFKEFLRQTNA